MIRPPTRGACPVGTCAAGEGAAGGRGTNHDAAEQHARRCRVEMAEVAVSRPLRWIPDSLLARALDQCPDAHSVKGKAVIDRGTRTIDLVVRESIDCVSMQIANMLGEPAIADPNLDAHRQTPPP